MGQTKFCQKVPFSPVEFGTFYLRCLKVSNQFAINVPFFCYFYANSATFMQKQYNHFLLKIFQLLRNWIKEVKSITWGKRRYTFAKKGQLVRSRHDPMKVVKSKTRANESSEIQKTRSKERSEIQSPQNFYAPLNSSNPWTNWGNFKYSRSQLPHFFMCRY